MTMSMTQLMQARSSSSSVLSQKYKYMTVSVTASLFFITLTQARRILRLKAEPLENLSVDQIHDKFIHEKLKMVIKIKRKREKEGFLPFGIFVRGKNG